METLRALFPDARHIELIGSGYETEVFSLEADGDKFALRLYPGPVADEKAAWEFEIMARLRSAGYPVPAVRHLWTSSESPVGRPKLTMDWIEGLSMEKEYWSRPEIERSEVARSFFMLMSRLHDLDLGIARPAEDEITYLRRLSSGLDANIGLHRVLDWAESQDVEPAKPCLVHGDFHRNNVLVTPQGELWVIDWSNSKLGDFRSDLAWIRLLTRAQGDDDLQLYEEVSGRRVKRIDYFEVLAATKILASTLLSLRFGPETQGLRPEAREMMLRDPSFVLGTIDIVETRSGLTLSDLREQFAACVP